jgi:hypothetical protein
MKISQKFIQDDRLHPDRRLSDEPWPVNIRIFINLSSNLDKVPVRLVSLTAAYYDTIIRDSHLYDIGGKTPIPRPAIIAIPSRSGAAIIEYATFLQHPLQNRTLLPGRGFRAARGDVGFLFHPLFPDYPGEIQSVQSDQYQADRL